MIAKANKANAQLLTIDSSRVISVTAIGKCRLLIPKTAPKNNLLFCSGYYAEDTGRHPLC
jgi:hypothetical protein